MELTLYSLTDYNNGVLVSHTFDLDLIDTKEEYLEAINEWLSSIKGEPREEWIVCDYEDIPSNLVGEYDLDDSFWNLKEIAGELENQGYSEPWDIIEAFISYQGDCDFTATDLLDAYQGQADSDEDFVYQLCMDCNDWESNELFNYIDWERVTRDYMMDFHEFNGYYFRC